MSSEHTCQLGLFPTVNTNFDNSNNLQLACNKQEGSLRKEKKRQW